MNMIDNCVFDFLLCLAVTHCLASEPSTGIEKRGDSEASLEG
jgi:hypothetical protein